MTTGDGEREKRDELERLQVELREAKQELAAFESAEPLELASLRDAVAKASEQRAGAGARKRILEAEAARLETEARQLGEALHYDPALPKVMGIPDPMRLLRFVVLVLGLIGAFFLYNHCPAPH